MEDETKNLLHRQKKHFFMSDMLPQKKCMKRRIGTKNKLSIRIHEKFFHKNGSRSIIHCSSACFPILPCPESMT